MALSRALILVALIATIFSTVTEAAEFIVGDDKGWTTNVDYQAWAANKVFRVGDRIAFNYPAGKDNVVIVNPTDFMDCSVPPNALTLSSGHDGIIFVAPGPRYYISSVGDNCKLGQRLALFVLPRGGAQPISSPPAPAPWSDAPEYPSAPAAPEYPSVPAAPALPSSDAPAGPPVAPFVPGPPAPAPWSDAPPSVPAAPALPSSDAPAAPFVPGPPAPAPWADTPSPSPEPYATWTTSFSHFAPSVPRKLFKVFQ